MGRSHTRWDMRSGSGTNKADLTEMTTYTYTGEWGSPADLRVQSRPKREDCVYKTWSLPLDTVLTNKPANSRKF